MIGLRVLYSLWFHIHMHIRFNIIDFFLPRSLFFLKFKAVFTVYKAMNVLSSSAELHVIFHFAQSKD